MTTVDTLFAFAANTQSGNATGANPTAGLTADAQGNLYGTATYGGANSTGAVYELVKGANGYTQQTLFSFAANSANSSIGNATGANPTAGLTADAQGNLYGTTVNGGANNAGAVYALVKGGNGYSQQTLFSFSGGTGSSATGANPYAGLIADAQGNLYGTTRLGGANGTGAVYELVKGPNGYSQQTLFSFAANSTGNATGANPYAGLTTDAQGNLYGTTGNGGANGTGAVYELVKGSNGYSQQTLFSFAANTGAGNATGAYPYAGLTADAQGNLYGTTNQGGTNDTGAVYELVKGANGYTQQTLFSFAAGRGGNATGASPSAGLIADAQGNLYGTTRLGGANGDGAVYELVKGANGYSQQTLFSFAASTGANPTAGLTADAQGNLYGTATYGGASDTGAVFRVSNNGSATPTQPTNPMPANPTPPANNAPCYCTGTRIMTDHGPVAVEALVIGDRVVTAAGAHRPIRWIGTRSYGGRFANANPAILPVCVKAGALADAVPARDLWVSPEHALFLDGVLVPAEHLVNGASIVKARRVESVTYWHVELDSHDVLLAEDAPAESFVDDGGRAIFHNAAAYRALYPQAPSWAGEAAYCAPRVTDGFALEAIRRRLAVRAGLPVAPARTFGALRGHLDLCAVGADGTLRVAGWAWDLAHPGGPVCLDVVVDGAVVGLAYAEAYRADLEAAGIGDGRHGFDVTVPLVGALDESLVVLRRSADGAVLGTVRPAAVVRLAA